MFTIFNKSYSDRRFREFLENNSIEELYNYAKEHQEQRKKIEKFVTKLIDRTKRSSPQNLILKASFLLQKDSEVLNIINYHGSLQVNNQDLKKEAKKASQQIDEDWRILQINRWLPPNNSLHSACQAKDAALIKKLIRKNRNANEKDKDGNTPIHHYCQGLGIQDPKIIKLLIIAGADLNEQNKKGLTPLHLALQQNKIDLAKYLILKGASLSIKDKAGKTPLDLLCDQNQEEKALLLLKDFCEKTHLDPFEMALRLEQYDLSHLLALETKQDQSVIRILEQSKQNKISPLTVILDEELDPDINLVNFFIEKGSSLNPTNPNDNPPLNIALRRNLDLKFAKILIEHGALLNQLDKKNQAPLHYAILNNKLESAKFLIEHGASLIQKDNHGYTPLLIATILKITNIEFLRLLIGDGHPLTQKSDIGDTPLCRAIKEEMEDPEVIKLLVGNGKPINIQGADGCIPLHHELYKDTPNQKIVQLLINAGSELDLPNQKLTTCFDLLESEDFPLPTEIKDVKFTYEYRLRKLIANAWTMPGTTSFPEKKITQDLEGGKSDIGAKEGLRLLQLFVNHPKQKTLLQKSFDSILEATKNSKGDVSQIFKKFKKNQPLRFTTGWSEHAVDVIIVEDLLLICNRGDERKKPSIKAYRIDRNQSTMTEKDFETLQERNITNDQNMIEFIYDTLPSKLSKKPPDHLIKFINKTCRQKSQKIGNCWWVNPMAGIFACLLMEKLIPLDKKFETEKEKTKAFQAAFDEVQPIFKQFSEFARVEVAKEYMLRKPDEIGRDHQLIRRIVNKLDSKKWKHLFEENNIGKLPPLFKKTEFTSIVDNYKNAFNLDEDFNPISAA